MSQVLVQCPNPACPGRSVEGETVNRETWEATWQPFVGNPPEGPGWWGANIYCPRCSTQGIDPESGQLDSAEEELGTRCLCCGVVNKPTEGQIEPFCQHCGETLPA